MLNRQDFFEEATKPVSDLESLTDELKTLLKVKKNGTKAQRLQTAEVVLLLDAAVTKLMDLDDPELGKSAFSVPKGQPGVIYERKKR